MTELESALIEYTELEYPFVSIYKNPSPHSCDNLLLVTATTQLLFGYPGAASFTYLAEKCEVLRGVYVRYPGADPKDQLCQHDDLTAIAAVAPYDAEQVADHGFSHHWTWGPWPKGWKILPIDFIPTIKAAAGLRLSLFDRLRWTIGIVVSCFTARTNTTGKCLAYLKIHAVEQKAQAWPVEPAIRFWRKRMTAMYPGGLRELYSIWYQDPDHPLRRFAPEHF